MVKTEQLIKIKTGGVTQEQLIEHINNGGKIIAYLNSSAPLGSRYELFGQPARIIRFTNVEEYIKECLVNLTEQEKEWARTYQYFAELSLD